jgi:putative FmdB family regulatory protein
LPIYQFKCLDCGNDFELITLLENKSEVVCPHCLSKNLKEVLSPFACGGGDKTPYGPGCT